MSKGLSKTTCALHPERPAAARCPQCADFYCPECITEHEGKMICASCLGAESVVISPEAKRGRFPFWAILQLAVALILCWLAFYYTSGFLSDLPDDFHDGTIWE